MYRHGMCSLAHMFAPPNKLINRIVPNSYVEFSSILVSLYLSESIRKLLPLISMFMGTIVKDAMHSPYIEFLTFPQKSTQGRLLHFAALVCTGKGHLNNCFPWMNYSKLLTFCATGIK
ncbi:unnamed protein product [Strongylus vulgaris]|uniref:Uncharacterized protein n=1 Tax=Strongylus vulgaris TaxID=40348 RepID=A0A3P7IKD4_STRVU|nr:unnamed protein product [Strongylus vulgaris]